MKVAVIVCACALGIRLVRLLIWLSRCDYPYVVTFSRRQDAISACSCAVAIVLLLLVALA